MTKRERAEIEQVIRELMEGDDPPFDRAVARLCKLVGWRYPAGEIAVHGTDVFDLMLQRPPRSDMGS